MSLVFLAGLPRSGSTVLCNLLGQHPDLAVTATSPLCEVVKTLRDNWRTWHRTVPTFDKDKSLIRVLDGLLKSYHESTKVLDKNRNWPELLQTVEAVTGEKVKVIVTVRSLDEVAASMEKIWRANQALGRVPATSPMTTAQRVAEWAGPKGLIGQAVSQLEVLKDQGMLGRVLVVDYSELTTNPRKVASKCAAHLGLSDFNFDPDNITQLTSEDDEWHGYTNLHRIRNSIEAIPSYPAVLLGEATATELRDHKGWWSI